jgi:hypothetical protein
MNRKAQALLELALFVGIMLMVLLAALSYQRNLREQKFADQNVFDQTVRRADKEVFSEKDIDGETWKCTGAIVSYNLNIDRQANRIFQGGQRRTTGSSASVYYSGAEDPPNYDFSYYNNTDYADNSEKIYTLRAGSADPEDALKYTTADYIALAYPLISRLASWMFNLKNETWFTKWDKYLRAATSAYFVAQWYIRIGKMDDAATERATLEAKDKEMGEWGWRVCDEVHDGKARAGKEYVKEISPQVYNMETVEDKSIDYDETQQADKSIRSVTIGDEVTYKIFRRKDMTSPNPTIPPQDHNFVDLGSKEVKINLGGSQSETWN